MLKAMLDETVIELFSLSWGGNAGNADPVNPRAKSICVKSAAPVSRVSIYMPCFRFHPRGAMVAMKWINARCGWILCGVAWNGIYTSFNCRRARRENLFREVNLTERVVAARSVLEERAHKRFHPSSILTRLDMQPRRRRRRRSFIYRVPSRNLQPSREERSFRLSLFISISFSL